MSIINQLLIKRWWQKKGGSVLGGVTVEKISQTEMLQGVFRQAQAAKLPVSAYCKPLSGGITLDFSDWKEIALFDMDNLMVVVPPGTILKDLNAVVAAKGLRFLPADTPLLESLTVGEWAYRGCPNPSAWKYSAGKHFLLGATYVLPNGEVVPVGGKCIKNVTGYDLTRFFTGAYADLAVGVQYIIKLMPQPEYRCRYDIALSSLADVAKLISELQRCSVPPAWLFWFDAAAGSRLFPAQQQGQRVMFELDGNKAEVHSQATAIDKVLQAINGKKAAQAADLPDLSFVENCADSFWLLDELKLSYPSVTDFAGYFAGELKSRQLGGGLFGQLADGKLHLYFDQALSPAITALVEALQDKAKSLGGTSSGKYDRLYGNRADTPLAGMEKTIKKIIDPELIFNRREG